MAGQQKPWEKYGTGAPSQGIPIKSANPRLPYEAPLAAADVAAKAQEAQIRALQIDKMRREAAQGSGELPPPPGDPNKSGAEYLASLPRGLAPTVQAVLDGRQAPPTSFALSKPYWQQIMSAANQIDPSFDQSQWAARVQVRKNYESQARGTPSGVINSLNTLAAHANSMFKNHLQMAGPNLGPLSGPVAGVMQSFDQHNTPAYNTEIRFVQGELQKLVNQGAATVSEAEALVHNLRAAQSFEARGEAIKAVVGLAEGKIAPIRQGWSAVMGDRPLPTDVTPSSMAVFDNILADGKEALPVDRYGTPIAPSSGAPRNPDAPVGPPTQGGGAGGPPSLNGGGGRGIGGPGMPGGSPLDGTQQYYRNPTGGPGGGFSVPTDGMISVPDPQRAAQAEKLSAMVADRRNADQAIVAFAQQSGLGVTPGLLAQLKFRKDHPDYNGAYKAEGFGFRDVPMSGAQKAFNAVGDNPVGAGVINAGLTFGQLGNGLTGGALEHAFGDPQQNRTVIAAMNQQHPLASTIGSVGGGIAGAAGAEAAAAKGLAKVGLGKFAPRLAPILGDAGFGAAQGAGAAQDGQRLNGAMLGGVFGVGGGMLGRGGTKAVGSALSGVQNSAVKGLEAAGVPLTFGQAVSQSGRLGAAAKSVEDAMTHLPLVGNMISARRAEGVRGFNQAAFREALDPIKTAPIDAVAEPGIDAAKQAVAQGYDNALGGVSATADQPFISDMSAAIQRGKGLPDPMGSRVGYTLDQRVGNSFDPTGTITGNGFQQASRGLTRDSRAVAHEPYGYDFGSVTGDAQGALNGLIARQAPPGTLPKYQAANQAHRNVSTLTDAVDAARNGGLSGETGLFMPSQLATAASKNARRFGGTQGTTNQPFFDLTRAGQAVLPSKIGDSGTAIRAAVGGAVLGGGTGLGYASGDTAGGAEAGGASLLALALGGSKVAQRALVAAMLKRPDSFKYAGNALGTYGVRPGGMLGAAVSPYVLPGTP